MSINQKIVHFKYCRIVSEHETLEFAYKSSKYNIIFESEKFERGKGCIIENDKDEFVNTDLLLWLTVYFGEDFIEPFPEVDTRFCHTRGDFHFNKESFKKFLNSAENFPRKSYPKWKSQLLDKAIIYFSVAVRSGINYMPLTIGFFAMSLECIGNIRYGKRDKYYTLDNKHFLRLLRAKLKRYKQNPSYRESTKSFEKFIIADIELLQKIRNSHYGHSLLHLPKDRKDLTSVLRKWYKRSGHNAKFAEISFKSSRIDKDITREAHGLYKIGLRTSRLLIFMLMGFYLDVPFTSHDFVSIGDLRKGESSTYRGVKFTLGEKT